MSKWHHEHVPGGISIGEGYTGITRQVIMINPTERGFYCTGYNKNRRGYGAYILWFGAYGWTKLHVYAASLEDAPDECIDWIVEHAPGLLCDDSIEEEYKRLIAEGVSEEDAIEQAEVDTTSGGNAGNHINSSEWGIALENPTTEQLYNYIQGK